jgi:RNase P subunit RPR2
LSTALEYFYRSHGFGKGVQDKDVANEKIQKTTTTIRKKGDKEIIESGTFLRVYCPHCDESLIEENSVKFKITHDDNKEGFLMLSPYLNVFTNESNIYIPEGEVVKKIDCPHCNSSLIIKGKKCELCGSKIVGVSIAALSKYIEFYFCAKKGCRWHGLSDEDIDDIMLEDSEEW